MSDVLSDRPMSDREMLRRRIVDAAAALLKDAGRDAVTTRAVAKAVGVPAPTIYRLFEDKAALIDAVVHDGFAAFLAGKYTSNSDDPLEDFRQAWARHVDFGLQNPALFTLMFGEARSYRSAAALESEQNLKHLVRRLARAGLLRVSEDHAVEVIQAVGQGVVLRLLAVDDERRDVSIVDTTRDVVIAAITLARPAVDQPGPAAAAIALRARLDDVGGMSEAELALLDEWLDRIEQGGHPPAIGP